MKSAPSGVKAGGGPSRKPAGGEPTAILVRTPNWLGDLLMGTSLLGALLDLFPRAKVDLIVRKGFESLPLPHRGAIYPYHKESEPPGPFGRRFWGGGHSHFIVMPPSFSSAWMAFRSGIPYRIGRPGEFRSLLLRPAVAFSRPHRSVHLVAEYLELLAPWLEPGPEATPEQYHPRLELPEEWSAWHLPGGRDWERPFVVLAPGAEYGPAKKWPTEHYRRLARAIAAEGWAVLVTGLPRDRPMAGEIIEGLKEGGNLCGETDLPGLVALMNRAALIVSNDSGAMHIAAALHRPQIAIFGSSNPTWTGPLNAGAQVFYRGLPCSPCYRRECPLGHTNCLTEILPEQVAGKALELLKK